VIIIISTGDVAGTYLAECARGAANESSIQFGSSLIVN